MGSLSVRLPAARDSTIESPWRTVVQAGASLAAAMGVGRFVYTPILPLMQERAGLSAVGGAHLATANYVGYLLGALAGIAFPGVSRSPMAFRTAFVALIASLVAMPATENTVAWMGLRLIAGFTSALIFVITVNALHARLRGHPGHLSGWAFGGIGAGIALSGALVLVLHTIGDWRSAWIASALAAAVLAAAAWRIRLTPDPMPDSDPIAAAPLPPRRWGMFAALFTSYTLEGVGYIIAGTFLVAAIAQTSSAALASGAWVLVGVAALPSAACWAWLAHRRSSALLLITALLLQAIGIALPALTASPVAALISAVLFGATFVGIVALSLATGAALRFPHAVALLTTGYSVGQIAGPLLAAPLLHTGYRPAMALAAAIILAAACATIPLRRA
ncbi:YbfB/YjiJ family MFS transporter [Nocardia sp. NPDC088792]|uniref:YbfB/YjiJ family MFS transporter n=1 Tax=Nocardia sp. NPDC088792 TaxID=3364332 RepID=UPI0037FE359A